jgi:CheY-like chemotaxis protein
MSSTAHKLLKAKKFSSLMTIRGCGVCSSGFFDSKAIACPRVEHRTDGSAVSREVFNLVVLDLMMPGEDGLTACNRLRGRTIRSRSSCSPPRAMRLSRIKGLELGADDYLAKPFNPRELWHGSRPYCAVRRPGTGCAGQRRRKRHLWRLRIVAGHP